MATPSDLWAHTYLGPGREVRDGAIVAPACPGADADNALDTAVGEARAQAAALKRAVEEAEAVLERCRELLDSLRSILELPSAYGWHEGNRSGTC